MPFRQIEIVIPPEEIDVCRKLMADESVVHYWQDSSDQSGYLLKVLVDAVHAEKFLDNAEQLFGSRKDYRLVMHSVDAILPRIEKKEAEDIQESVTHKEQIIKGLRISREELYSEISSGVRLTRIYMALVILSTVVAALGMLRDNTAVVIGAMVIAPLLAPNVGLALSTTLGDLKLGLESVKTNMAGLLTALVISILLGATMQVDSSLDNIASRTEVHLSDISLALASGAAGVLAYTVGMSTAVIGVMVAVALLPPLVTAGLLIGDLQLNLAYYAVLLLLTNIICVNLSGIATFILQGVRPRTWYETEKAKQIHKTALIIWIILLLILASLIYYY